MNIDKFNSAKAIQQQIETNRSTIASLDEIRTDNAVLTIMLQTPRGTVVVSDNALNQTLADEIRTELSKRNDDLQADFDDL